MNYLQDFANIFSPQFSIQGFAYLVLLLPLFSSLVLFVFDQQLKKAADTLATAFMGMAFVAAVVIYTSLNNIGSIQGKHEFIQASVTWFNFPGSKGNISFSFSMLLNNTSSIMLMVVTLISFLVHLFSIEYMRGKRNYTRYFAYLSIFTFAMLGIVISDNLLVTFMFWEIVGFSSYLIIGFWFDKVSAVKASKKAFLFNRIGDMGFLIAILIIYSNCNTLEISKLVTEFYKIPDTWLFITGIGLFASCAGKSAQVPLQLWLPDAMEGPTPASALIHAATMVAAGVYLLTKIYFILPEEVKTIITCTGALTAIAGSIPALVQYDIKKVLAYSTISQLGYMVMGIGFQGYESSFFHLITHAFFKAGLFLAAGSIINAMHHIKHDLFNQGVYSSFDAQDMRLMGGFSKKMPVTFLAFVICSLSLIGVPFFSGFLSKEILLDNSLNWASAKYSSGSSILYFMVPLMAYTTLAITTIYMSRQIYLIFFGDFRLAKLHNSIQQIFTELKEKYILMIIPLIVLSICSLWIGFSINPFNGYHSWVYRSISIQTHSASFNFYPLLLILVAFLFFFFRKNKSKLFKETEISNVVLNNWYLDRIYYHVLVLGGFRLAFYISQIDKKIIDPILHYTAVLNVVSAHIISWIDRVIVDGVVTLVSFLSGKLGEVTRTPQTGKIQQYFLISMMLFVILIGLIYLL